MPPLNLKRPLPIIHPSLFPVLNFKLKVSNQSRLLWVYTLIRHNKSSRKGPKKKKRMIHNFSLGLEGYLSGSVAQLEASGYLWETIGTIQYVPPSI